MNVPNEIFAKIFTLLPDRSSLINAALVCKRWHDAAIPLIWMEIKLSLDPSTGIDPTLFGEAIKTPGGRECTKWIKVLSFNFNMAVMTSSMAPTYHNHITTSYFNVIRSVQELAVNITLLRIYVPKIIVSGIFPSRSTWDTLGGSALRWSRAQTVFQNILATIIRAQKMGLDEDSIHLDLEIDLPFLLTNDYFKESELYKRCTQVVQHYRQIINTKPQITNLSIMAHYGPALIKLHDLLKPIPFNRLRHIHLAIGPINASDNPNHAWKFKLKTFPFDFWRIVRLPTESLSLRFGYFCPTLLPLPTAFSTSLHTLKITCDRFFPSRFTFVKTVLTTLWSLERFSYIEEMYVVFAEPTVTFEDIAATNLKQLFIQSLSAIDVSLWKAVGRSCPNLKVIRFADNQAVSKDAIEALCHLNLKKILFNYWDDSTSYRLSPDLVVSALSAFPSARIEMGWRLFKATFALDNLSLYETTRLNPAVADVWIQHRRAGKPAGQEIDRIILERWYEGSTIREIQEKPKAGEEWLEGEYPLEYIRISFDVIRQHGL
jgi:hypothetical protein